MFYEVKILDSKGKVKKVLSSRQLSRRYWDAFRKQLKGQTGVVLVKRGRKPGRISKKTAAPNHNAVNDYESELGEEGGD